MHDPTPKFHHEAHEYHKEKIMRLTTFEITAINQNAKNIFGDAAKVYLFGSRVDDSKKGGDIDLYVISENQDNLYEKKLNF
jgi:uncharacterized protein